MFCKYCGAEINDDAVVCVKCGRAVNSGSEGCVSKSLNPADVSPKDWVTTLLLCFFLGGFGIHRFYVGKTGTGVIQLLTLGLCGVWTLIDFILIAVGNFTDAEGKKIVNEK